MSEANKGDRSPTSITHHLKGISFPASREELVEHAEENGADADVIEKIEQMPDEEYGSMADVMKGYGETT